MGHGGTDFYLILNSKASKLPSIVYLNFGPKEKGPFFSNFAVVSHFSITRFDIIIFCNILYLEINFGNLH